MSKRDEYVEMIKNRLDAWNADIKKLEASYEKAEAGARVRLREQIASLQRHREEAQNQVRRIEDAAEEAWHELAKGAEEAWKRIGDAFARARSHAEEKKVPEAKAPEKKAPVKKASGKKKSAKTE